MELATRVFRLGIRGLNLFSLFGCYVFANTRSSVHRIVVDSFWLAAVISVGVIRHVSVLYEPVELRFVSTGTADFMA